MNNSALKTLIYFKANKENSARQMYY